MLDRLQALHDAAIKGIDALEALATEVEPRLAEVAAARLAISKVSRVRASFLEATVYPAIEAFAPQAIAGLRSRGRERMLASSEHIKRWTTAELQTNWPEYRVLSKGLRIGMRARIREEQALLYPLILRLRKAA
ncbi:hypothetical protein [Sphingomonas montanisoli]|uniref:Uncharacterized protein n=1 Tax=Sphingomonas montanisoli TaxID=2606412 RepID=A0A5D9C1V7_9SPHN|nr:hypothetical protein [Sphingomonas montanisoli]TZG25040.1 hypothetical protein FYJ91_17400 [Sphingomonas montanisoli]